MRSGDRVMHMSRPIAIQARLNQAEADTIRAAAAARGLNVGSWLRMVALEAAPPLNGLHD